ncbi:MAG TPA: PilN domain-containing protein [Gemmatimonadaceae bacterium]|nr:PilN domain-containing protein [Gemmatimonadaceae bacterium]
MIEINLLPGAGKKSRSRSAGIDLKGAIASAVARVNDPYLIAAVASAVIAAAVVGGMFWVQRGSAATLDTQLQQATQDSIRFSTVIAAKHKAEAERDSVLRQVQLIESFDARRFVWPHIMEEVSQALPAYTWLTSIEQINAPAPAASKPATKGKQAAPVDTIPAVPPVEFRIVGNTVDLQALTRFMRVLEASPFIQNVQLAGTTLVLLDGKQVTEFRLTAAYQKPDPAVIHTVPISLAVR